jgi:hypothetical protein
MLFFFRHAKNFDARTEERHLKDVFKDVTRNSQQRGQDTFLCQVGAPMHEKLIMMPAMMTSPTLSHITRCMSSPTMKPTIPMDGIWAVAPPV